MKFKVVDIGTHKTFERSELGIVVASILLLHNSETVLKVKFLGRMYTCFPRHLTLVVKNSKLFYD